VVGGRRRGVIEWLSGCGLRVAGCGVGSRKTEVGSDGGWWSVVGGEEWGVGELRGAGCGLQGVASGRRRGVGTN